MPTGRSSGPFAVAEPHTSRRLRTWVLSLLLLAAVAAPAAPQQPVLRMAGEPVTGLMVTDAAVFPVSALARLGFGVDVSDAGFTARLDADTLRFWTTSPFFRAGQAVLQLAFPVTVHDGVAYLPEQFFIQWLPAAFPQRFQFRDGALARHDAAGAGAQAAAAAQPPAPPAQAAPPAGTATPPQAPPARTPPAQLPPTQTPPADAAAERRAQRSAQRVVIIDAGHGGRDPGKVGPNGLRESDVALLVSQRLAAVLRDRGYEVHMTRTSDTFVPLAERTRLANQWQADRPGTVFLSIHANSFESANVRGFETFFLSEARTDDERRVAEMENAVIRFEDNPQRPGGNDLDQVLVNLRSEYLTRASHDLAAIMQTRMAAFHPGPNRGVKRAPFYVLVGAVMPAVLIETAFISNRDEANLLGTQSFQQSLAWGIADGVDEFFQRNEHLWTQGR
jgi:N-acetylmuramoyl-L-alanine amidase